jgi:hypothetical protein
VIGKSPSHYSKQEKFYKKTTRLQGQYNEAIGRMAVLKEKLEETTKKKSAKKS